ncbi:MAG TPA: tetratricopeptide repeat protein, partial [Acidobacteriota bacterium]
MGNNNRAMLYLILFLYLLVPASSNSDTSSNVHFQQAEQAFKKSNYEESAAQYKLAIKEFEQQNDKSSLAVAYRNLGRVCRNIGKFEDAFNYLNTAIKMHEQMADRGEAAIDTTYMAIAYERQGNYGKAMALSEKALAVHT